MQVNIDDDFYTFIFCQMLSQSFNSEKYAVYEYVKHSFVEALTQEINFNRYDLIDENGEIDFTTLQDDFIGKDITKISRYLLKYAEKNLTLLDLDAPSLRVSEAHKYSYDDIPHVKWMSKEQFFENGWSLFSDRHTLDFSVRDGLRNLQIVNTDLTFINTIRLPQNIRNVFIGSSFSLNNDLGTPLVIDARLCENIPYINATNMHNDSGIVILKSGNTICLKEGLSHHNASLFLQNMKERCL